MAKAVPKSKSKPASTQAVVISKLGSFGVAQFVPHVDVLRTFLDKIKNASSQQWDAAFEELTMVMAFSGSDMDWDDMKVEITQIVSKLYERVQSVLNEPQVVNIQAIVRGFQQDMVNMGVATRMRKIDCCEATMHEPGTTRSWRAGNNTKGDFILQGEEPLNRRMMLPMVLENTFAAFPPGLVEIYRVPNLYFGKQKTGYGFGAGGKLLIKIV